MERTQALKLDTKILYSAAPTILKLGFTLILLAYFLVWLPQAVVGLSFIGLDLGEWVKFLPQLRSGELSLNRNLFYLPPITLGLMLTSWTIDWPNRRWQTWVVRGIAILIACLAFPAFEVILDEQMDQWLLRILLITVVILATILAPILKRLLPSHTPVYTWLTIIFLGLVGASWPTWAFLAIRPIVTELFGVPVGIGPGVTLNIVGHLLAAGAAIVSLFNIRRARSRS